MGVEAVAVDVPALLDEMHAQYTRMSADNDAKAVLLTAAQVIVEQARQLAEARAEKPRIVVP